MSIVHIRHIMQSLDKEIAPYIDMADYHRRPQEHADDALHTRAQAAYSLVVVAKLEPRIAANAVTDGFQDNGIDALFFDQDEKTLYLVQSKWRKNGQGSIDVSEVTKFVKGARDLVEANFAEFNDKVREQESAVVAALDDPNLRLHLVLVHTGVQALSPDAKRMLSGFLNELNDASPIATATTLTQADLHKAISSDAEGSSIKIEVMLHEWGQCKQPYSAYYGQVDAADVGRWWQEHQQRLFAKNLRKFTGSTEVNEGIKGTLQKDAAKFWYFNNGITVLCSSLKKKPLGGARRTSGVFVCEGFSVVNGAQTVGCIGETAALSPDTLTNARVGVRLISLANCPPDFGSDITRAANTQNRIERRDFAALDPEQDRLRRDLQLELGKTYYYKSGDTPGTPAEGCTIEEATVALACAEPDHTLAVQAKREVGKLWEDIQKPPYKLLFNRGLTALHMWRLVEILRIVETSLKKEQDANTGRKRMVAVHGNRIVLHLVCRVVGLANLDHSGIHFDQVKQKVRETTPLILNSLFEHVESEFPTAYTNSLFKNASKCRTLVDKLTSELSPKAHRGTSRE